MIELITTSFPASERRFSCQLWILIRALFTRDYCREGESSLCETSQGSDIGHEPTLIMMLVLSLFAYKIALTCENRSKLSFKIFYHRNLGRV